MLRTSLNCNTTTGGQEIDEVREGPVVVPIPERYRDTPDLRYVLLTPEERPRACATARPPGRTPSRRS